jgi:hypothetical protein
MLNDLVNRQNGMTIKPITCGSWPPDGCKAGIVWNVFGLTDFVVGFVMDASTAENSSMRRLYCRMRLLEAMTKRRPRLICVGVVGVIIKMSLTSALTCCTGTIATAAVDLYRAQAIVTGQGEANRIIGFAS